MSATKLDGTLYRDEIFSDLAQRVSALKEKGITPGLATVLVGEDPGSQSYVKMKHRDCEKLGINSIRKDLPADITQEELEAVIDELNADGACTGYIVQLPLPKHLDENAILERIDPAKDADGLHPVNLGKLVLNEEAPLPCTPNGCLHLLRRFGDFLGDVTVEGPRFVYPLSLSLAERLYAPRIALIGDAAHGPYGPQPIADVRRHATRIADELVEGGCKMLVIACNTASAGRASSPRPSTSAAIWVSSALSVALSARARGKPSIAMAR